MTPIKITFTSRESITLYSEDPASFVNSILERKPAEIIDVQYNIMDGRQAAPELQEVRLSLESGPCILGFIAKADVAKADYIEEIVECDTTHAITYGKLAKIEIDLDERFTAASAVINNIPDLDVRLTLHEQYLKRKSAYVSAVEALVDGVIRRPEK
jgi:hypothetical protein